MEDGGFYHDRHTAMLSTDHIRNIGSKVEYASIAKGNAKARYAGSILKYGGFGDFGIYQVGIAYRGVGCEVGDRNGFVGCGG